MRRLRILIPDKAITDHIETIISEAKDELAKTGTLSEATVKKYNYSPLKDIKLRESSNKCVYCESKILSTQPGELDHLIPKAKCIKENNINLLYSYENLALVCRICNSKKSNLGSTEPLLSPYTNRPEHHIYYAGDVPIARTNEGRKTIISLELDIRDDLIISVRKRVCEVAELISNYLREQDVEIKNSLKRRIYRQGNHDKEYSSAINCLIKAMKI